jgi:hypothetical protein
LPASGVPDNRSHRDVRIKPFVVPDTKPQHVCDDTVAIADANLDRGANCGSDGCTDAVS